MRVILALCAMLFATSANAAIYRYTGAAYDTVGSWTGQCDQAVDYTCLSGSYTTDMRVQAEFEYSGFLPSSAEILYLSVWLFDGLITHRFAEVSVKTDAVGNIVTWSFYIQQPDAGTYVKIIDKNTIGTQISWDREFTYWLSKPGYGPDQGYFTEGFEGHSASTTNIGSWEVIAPVPLSASGALLLTGLGVFGLRRFRPKRPL